MPDLAARSPHPGTTKKVTGDHAGSWTQVTVKGIVKQCDQIVLRRSMDHTGSRYNHATVESFWSFFKHEYYYRHVFTTLEELRAGIEAFMHRYNHHRRYSKIGSIAPVSYELYSESYVAAAT